MSVDDPEISNPVDQHQDLLILDGTWEQSGRSSVTAAIIILLAVGALYLNASSIVSLIAILITNLFYGTPDINGDLLERLSGFMTYYAEPIRITVTISQFLFLLVPVLWIVKRWHTANITSYIRLNACPASEILLAVAATVLMIPTGNWILSFLAEAMRIPHELTEINEKIFSSYSVHEFAFIVLVVCVTPAICEEIFFRGYIQRTLERTISWKSILFTGVAFGLFHFQPLGLVSLSIMGFLFGFFYFRSKSLLPSMISHFVNNFIAVVSLYKTTGTQEPYLRFLSGQIPLWFVAATLPILLLILFLYYKRT